MSGDTATPSCVEKGTADLTSAGSKCKQARAALQACVDAHADVSQQVLSTRFTEMLTACNEVDACTARIASLTGQFEACKSNMEAADVKFQVTQRTFDEATGVLQRCQTENIEAETGLRAAEFAQSKCQADVTGLENVARAAQQLLTMMKASVVFGEEKDDVTCAQAEGVARQCGEALVKANRELEACNQAVSAALHRVAAGKEGLELALQGMAKASEERGSACCAREAAVGALIECSTSLEAAKSAKADAEIASIQCIGEIAELKDVYEKILAHYDAIGKLLVASCVDKAPSVPEDYTDIDFNFEGIDFDETVVYSPESKLVNEGG